MSTVERNPFEAPNRLRSPVFSQEDLVRMSKMKDGGGVVVVDDELNPKDTGLEYDTEDGGVIVSFGSMDEDNEEIPDADILLQEEEIGQKNLVEFLEDDELRDIANLVYTNYMADKDSRSEWESMFEKGFDLLGLKLLEASEPFQGACTAVHPVLIESAVKFQSKAIQELFPAAGPVRTQIIGEHTEESVAQADRIKKFMNYQLTDMMPEYFEEMERMLFHLPLIGSAFKKVYFDKGLNRPVSEFVPIDQFYVSYYATDLRRANRYTHVIYRSPVEMQRDIAAGMYADMALGQAGMPDPTAISSKLNSIMGLSSSSLNDPQYVLLEQHCYLQLPEHLQDGVGDLSLPYIVTLEEKSQKVLSIRRNYDQNDPRKEKRVYFTHYRFVPGFGFYGLGLIHFLGNLTMTATAAMRSLIDAGQFASLPAGFKAKGVRIVGDNTPIGPGEWKEVEAVGNDLTKMIIPLPYKEPSQTLFQMLGFVTGAAQKFADSTEQVVSEAASYGPVGTTMALLEASSKFFSAIHKRLHKSQKDEFKLLASINYDYLPEESLCHIPDNSLKIYKADFDGRIDVIPSSDPNIPSNAHRMMMGQMALQMANSSPPGMFNMEELNRNILSAANIPNLDLIMPRKVEAIPLDPLSDIAAAVKGLPIKAFIGQNHEAHVQAKTLYVQDPLNGGSPFMQRIVPVLQANISEHMILKYQEQVNGVARQMLQMIQQQGMEVGQQDQSIDPNDPKVIEMVMAQAAQQVSQANQAMAAQQAAGTPEAQMVALEGQRIGIEGQRISLEGQRVQIEMAKASADSQLKQQELAIKEAQVKANLIKETLKATSEADRDDKNRVSKEAIAKLNAGVKQAGSAGNLKLQEDMKAADLMGTLVKESNKLNGKTPTMPSISGI